MDEVLERILTLIPRKTNGDFKHGAKSAFCRSIGIKSQTLSDWQSGRSTSYMELLYKIAAIHNVPVEWLEHGNSSEELIADERKAQLEEREMLQTIRDKNLRNLMDGYKRMTPQQIKMMERFMYSIMEDENAD